MKRSFILTALSFLVLAQLAWAQVPQIINYQGVLRDAGTKEIVPDGDYDITLRIYDVETFGTPLWSEVQTAVPVANGVFSVILGKVPGNSLPRPFPAPAWLGIKVDPDANEMTPRVELTAVPYSLTARSVQGYMNVFPSNGNVGIGTTAPGKKLHIASPDFDGFLLSDSISGKARASLINWETYGGQLNLRDVDGNTQAVIRGYATVDGYQASFTAGNVGIGTASPFDKLDVAGNIRTYDGEIFLRGGTDQAHGLGWYGDGTKAFGGVGVGGPVLYGSSGGGLGTSGGALQNIALYWDQAGNVGIGTTNPETPLHVKGWFKLESGDFFMGPDPDRGDGGRALVHQGDGSGNNDLLILNHEGDFESGVSVEGSRLEVAGDLIANGNVGIGVSPPAEALDVNGRIRVLNGVYSPGELLLDSDTMWDLKLNDQVPGNVIIATGGGRVGIGTATPDSPVKLHVAGIAKADTLQLATAAERWYSIPGRDFSMIKGSPDASNDTVAYLVGSAWSYHKFAAGVNLPHEAMITELMAKMEDNSTEWGDSASFWIDLWQLTPGLTPSSIATVTTTGIQAGIQTQSIGASHQVDNQNSTYLVTAAWRAPISPEQVRLKLYSVRIKYTVNQPLP